MSFGEVLSDELLIEYSIFLRNSPLARGLRNLIDLTWDKNSSYAGKKLPSISQHLLRVSEG